MNKLKPIHLALIAFAAFLAVNLSLQKGGFLLYGEADWFLIDHNNPDRSFLSKIICPHKHDAEHYMARELAHLVEHFDARFIHKCVMDGHPAHHWIDYLHARRPAHSTNHRKRTEPKTQNP